MRRIKVCRRYLSLDERKKYMNCDAPLKKMEETTLRYTTPWTPDKGLPKPRVGTPSFKEVCSIIAA